MAESYVTTINTYNETKNPITRRTYEIAEIAETFIAECQRRGFNLSEANRAIRKIESLLLETQI